MILTRHLKKNKPFLVTKKKEDSAKKREQNRIRQKTHKEELKQEIDKKKNCWENQRKKHEIISLVLDISKIFSFVLTVVIGAGVIIVSEPNKKQIVGVSGSIAIAIQTITNNLSLKKKIGKYNAFEAQALILISKLTVLNETHDIRKDLSSISSQINDLIIISSDLK